MDDINIGYEICLETTCVGEDCYFRSTQHKTDPLCNGKPSARIFLLKKENTKKKKNSKKIKLKTKKKEGVVLKNNSIYLVKIERMRKTDKVKKQKKYCQVEIFVTVISKILVISRHSNPILNYCDKKDFNDNSNNYFDESFYWNSIGGEKKLRIIKGVLMEKSYHEYIQPIFSKNVPPSAVARALVNERARCGETISEEVALTHVEAYIKKLTEKEEEKNIS